VRDLIAADFQVLENGSPQEIVAFEHVSIPAAIAGDSPATREPLVPPDVASNEASADARIFVLVLDAIHVDSRRTRVVREQARRFVERHVGPRDLTAVIAPGGLPSATQDFTSDKTRLLSAIDQFAGNKLRSATVERDEEVRHGTIVLHGGRDPSDGERANRVESLASVLEALARHLDRSKGRRKSLLLFSEGVDYDLNDVMGRVQRQGTDVMRALSRAIGTLQRTNVSVYPIDPRGLSSAEGDQVETPIYNLFPDPNQPSVYAEYGASIRGLRALADSTGGFAAVDSNDVAPAFERIAAESSEYYVLGYTPAKPAKPGESRSIGVLLSRPGLQVTARKGYTVPGTQGRLTATEILPEAPPSPWGTGRPPGGRAVPAPVEPAPRSSPSARDGLATLLASPLPHPGLTIRVQAIPFRGDDRKGVVQLVIEVLGRSLALTQRNGRFEERIELALLTVDARARASNGKSTTIDLRLTSEEADRVRATGVRWLSRLELPPGHHQVRVAGRANGSGATGLTTVDVDLPRFDAAQPAMSGVTLTSLPSVLMVTRGNGWLQEAIGTPPSATRSFVAGDRLTAAVEVYLPSAFRSAATVTARIEWPDGSRSPVGNRTSQALPGARGEVVAFPIDTIALPPGRYVLRMALTAGAGHGAVERLVPFDVVSAPAR
jgi:VWFA-related protein